MADRPGVMIYFEDINPFIEDYTNEECGILLKTIVNYAENGKWVSDDCPSTIRIALKVLKPKIDRDAESYEKKKLHGQWMTYVRIAKENGRDYLSEETWIERKRTAQNNSQ